MRLAMLRAMLVAAVLFPCLCLAQDLPQPRQTISLDGEWNFATDPQATGEAQRWFDPAVALPVKTYPGYAPKTNGRIIVPGPWDNQGYGPPTEKTRHNYVGKAWYKRDVSIPRTAAGQRLFLTVGGVHRYAKIWVNGRFLGEQIGYLSAFEYDLTPHITPGQPATLAIQVDSRQRWDVDGLFGAGDLADYMDIEWGGIWGHVALEIRSAAWLEDLFVQPRTSPPGCIVSATVNGAARDIAAFQLDIVDAANRPIAQSAPSKSVLTPGASIQLPMPLGTAKLWTPDTPHLYTARLSILDKDNRSIDTVETRFGLRQFSTDGHRLLLNGQPIFLRGYGDDHIYPRHMAMPVDKSVYLERLRLVKSYGFNHVRHHSTIMPPEYYDACDELGILSTAEFPIAYQNFYERAAKSPAAMETYRSQWASAILRHRNHPSILCWVMGNELWASVPLAADFFAIARRLDPTRFFVDTDGLFKNFVDRETLGLHFLMFDVGRIPLDIPDKFALQPPRKPVISHETGNYNTFPRLGQFDQFTGTIKPFWTDDGRQRLDRLGLRSEADAWALNSERLYLLCHKLNIEALRKSPYLSGHHWWLFQDYWTTSNGLVDFLYRPKSIRPEDVRPFINDLVVLADGLDVTCAAKRPLAVSLLISNYSPQPLANASLSWRLVAPNRRIASGQVPIPRIDQGIVAPAGRIELSLPDVATPTLLRLEVELPTPAGPYRNAWTTWLYPASPATTRPAVPVYATSELQSLLRPFGTEPLPEDKPLDPRAVYAASHLEPRLLDAVERGACLLLLNSTGVFPSHPATFKPSWWKGADERDNNCGTVVYPHPITKEIAPDGWCDAGWYHLLQGATRYNLESLPARQSVILRAIPHLHLIRDNAFLFEARVGKGSLIVSGLNHAAAKSRPEGAWLLSRMLRHAATFPTPQAAISSDFLRARLPAQPPPGPYVHGFRTLLTKDAETDLWYSYREDQAKMHICRQTRVGNLVEWEPAPIPGSWKGDSVTYRFAGGLGYQSQPKTEGFALLLSGTELLRFDLAELLKWSSPDGKATLTLIPRRALPEDQVGIFYLTIARDRLKGSEPVRLGVRSLGANSRRWFGLHPYAAFD